MPRILVVDDENNIRLMVRLALQASGYEVETASDGQEGLEKFGDGAGWDLVLLDQRMPDLEGVEVLRRMRRRQTAAKVIMITAFGTIDLAADAMRAGATDFLRKPFTTDVLRGAVQAALQGDSVPFAPVVRSEAAPTFRATSINGFQIASSNGHASSNGTVQSPPGAGGRGEAMNHNFQVRGPDGASTGCEVFLPGYFLELVKAHADREEIPDADHFWLWLCEEALANYLWQHAEPPLGGRLQVDELTTSLRRWIDAVLSSE